MIEKWYKWIWHDLFKQKQPFSYTARDLNKEWPLLFILIFLSMGIIIGVKFRKHWWKILLIIIAGIVIGHIFWPG